MSMNIGSPYGNKFFEQLNGSVGRANSHKGAEASRAKNADKAAEWIKEIKGDQDKTNATAALSKNNEDQLSDKAKEFVASLREKYGDFDFFVGKNEEEFEALSGAGSKEFSVIITMDEIEKMANDDKYAQEKMGMVENAVEMAKKITEESGYKMAGSEEEGQKGTVNKLSITIGDNGDMKIFAELEKSSEKQSERIAKHREEAANKKKEADKTVKNNPYEREDKSSVKRTNIEASNLEEFMEKIRELNWDKIASSQSGDKFNFSI